MSVSEASAGQQYFKASTQTLPENLNDWGFPGNTDKRCLPAGVPQVLNATSPVLSADEVNKGRLLTSCTCPPPPAFFTHRSPPSWCVPSTLWRSSTVWWRALSAVAAPLPVSTPPAVLLESGCSRWRLSSVPVWGPRTSWCATVAFTGECAGKERLPAPCELYLPAFHRSLLTAVSQSSFYFSTSYIPFTFSVFCAFSLVFWTSFYLLLDPLSSWTRHLGESLLICTYLF